jgi:predicted RecB family nuclease
LPACTWRRSRWAVQRRDLIEPHRENPHGDLIRRKGDEHEAAYLEHLRAEGRGITEIQLGENRDLEKAASRTEEALRAGGEIVYQGVLASDNWQGVADFLTRVEDPLRPGPFSYEAWDTKPARHAKPNAVLQLTFYSHELERIQGDCPSECTSSAQRGGDVPARRLRRLLPACTRAVSRPRNRSDPSRSARRTMKGGLVHEGHEGLPARS